MSKTALVTGATAGIGRATALKLHAAGFQVYVTGRRQDRLDALVGECPGVVPVCFDVQDEASVRTAFESHPAMRDVDVLVNNAGLARGTDSMQHADVADWNAMVQTNVLGLLYVTRPVSEAMAKRKGGHIVNLGSVAGRWVYPGGGVYCATKHAVGAITEGLRMDLLGTRVRVTNIEPGLVETEFSKVRFDGDEARAAAVYAGMQALSPDDVAETILWCIERPGHVNVQELVLYPTAQASVRDVDRA